MYNRKIGVGRRRRPYQSRHHERGKKMSLSHSLHYYAKRKSRQKDDNKEQAKHTRTPQRSKEQTDESEYTRLNMEVILK